MRTTICEVVKSPTPGENRWHVALSDDDGTAPVVRSGLTLAEATVRAKIERLEQQGLPETAPDVADLLKELEETRRQPPEQRERARN